MGERRKHPLGELRESLPSTSHRPTRTEAEAASRFNGKVSHQLADLLMKGDFDPTSNVVVAEDVINKWAEGTQKTTEIAVRALRDYLKCVGTFAAFFPPDGAVPEKTTAQRRREERALCNFAMLRVMAGQRINGVGVYVSSIRSWYRTIYQEEFGNVGKKGVGASLTSQYLAGMKKEYFPTDMEAEDERRAPVTWEHVKMFRENATRRFNRGERKWMDAGTATMVAYAGLFRMGELTSTDSNPFNREEDLCEDNLVFEPSFWMARRVEIRLGATKADQSGAKDKARPRGLPIDETPDSPGRAIRDMVARRHGVRRGEDPVLRKVPLFQNGRGGQLSRDSVLTFMRTALKQAGVPLARREQFGTHSCRIGGATRLFQLGATPEIFRQMGGWVSDAWKLYIRMGQEDLMSFTTKMCAG